MGVASSIVGLISACLLATMRQSATMRQVTDAFASGLRWQGVPSAVVLIGLLFV